jgi:membrane protein YdbS with pleckstrin-like domain
VIIMALAAVIHFILPIIAAVVVWFFTGSLLYAGIAFLAVAILQLFLRR